MLKMTAEEKLAKSDANGDLVLSFEGASGPGTIVQGLIRYQGSQQWSEAASSRRPGDNDPLTQAGAGMSGSSFIVPAVVVAVVLLVLVALLAVFLMRRRGSDSRREYDAVGAAKEEAIPASANSEETKKLKDDQAVA